MKRLALTIGVLMFVATSCGGSGDSDGSGGNAGSSGDGGNVCPTGECVADGGCVEATGPQGNALCTGPNGVCVGCLCASPDTPIATPDGDRRIVDLKVGDQVYSLDRGKLRSVPILETRRTPVSRHRVTRVELETGAILEISPSHPTADARYFSDLRAGEQLDGVAIVHIDTVAYSGKFTHDILPASDTGTYFAGGVLIGSTLARGVTRECSQSTPISRLQP